MSFLNSENIVFMNLNYICIQGVSNTTYFLIFFLMSDWYGIDDLAVHFC